MSEPGQHVTYVFGDFRLDPRRRLLFARDAPDALSIKPKVFEAILYFVERPGELLEKDQLMADLWPGLVVEESNLTHVISVMRRVLGEARGENRYVATVPGRGYRFVADVTRLPAESVGDASPVVPATPERPARSRRAAPIAFVMLACVLAVALFAYGWYYDWWLARDAAPPTVTTSPLAANLPSRTVAILPFANLSTDTHDEFVALGLSEGVLHRLADIRDLTLIARTSSFAFRDKPADARDIGRALNARYLVEGSVQRSGVRLRVTAQLIDATTGGHLWSLRFDRTIDDIFAVEDEISQRVAEALEVSLNEQRHPFSRFGADAYLSFLQGQSIIATKPADAERAIAHFSRAIEVAPTFAAAYVALADASIHHAHIPHDSELRRTAFRKAAAWLATALQLDATLGEAYVLRADMKVQCADTKALCDDMEMFKEQTTAEADYRRGLELSPNSGMGHEHFAEFLWEEEGRFDEALAEIDRARRVDPLTPRNHYVKGKMLMFGHKAGAFTEEAIEQAEPLFLQTLQLAPDFHLALWRLGAIRWYQGRFAEAVMLAERAVAIRSGEAGPSTFLVEFYLELEDVDAARSAVEEQADWLTICLQQRKFERATELLREDPGGRGRLDNDVEAYVIRDAALAGGHLARARHELLTLRINDVPIESDMFTMAVLAQVTLALGDRREAERLAGKVLENEAVRTEYRIHHAKAIAFAVLGQHAAALDTLEQGFARGYRKRWWYAFEREPAFEPLRSDPRFQSLAAKARAHAAAERKSLEKMRARGDVPARAVKAASGPSVC
jgi:TolB-like protein/DNA-binding winged helix-turn-helix (wHTH) protein/Tfp pilus assembly protein PilF